MDMCVNVLYRPFFSFFVRSILFVMIYVLTYIKHKVLNCPIGQSVDITSFTVLYYTCFMIVLKFHRHLLTFLRYTYY